MEFNPATMAARIRGKRAESSMTQEELAACTGLSAMSISDYEAGGTTPRADRLCQLARALDTTPNYLLGWDLREEASD